MHARKLCRSFGRLLENCDRHRMFSCIPMALLFCASLLLKLIYLSPVSSWQIVFFFLFFFYFSSSPCTFSIHINLKQLQHTAPVAWEGDCILIAHCKAARSYRPQLNFHTSLRFLCILFTVTAHRAYICTHKASIVCCMWPHGMSRWQEAGTLAVVDLLCYLGTSERAYFWLPVKTLKCKLGSYLGFDGVPVCFTGI